MMDEYSYKQIAFGEKVTCQKITFRRGEEGDLIIAVEVVEKGRSNSIKDTNIVFVIPPEETSKLIKYLKNE